MQLKTRIFDTHVHIWDRSRTSYTWLQHADPNLQRNFDLAELEPSRTSAGVTDGILVQAENSLADTKLMLEAARNFKWIKGVVGWLPLMNTVQTSSLIDDEWQKQPLLVGVRHLIHDEPDDRWLLQTDVVNSLELLAINKIPFDVVGINAQHIKTVLELANKIPSLKMVFDHMNQPPIQTGQLFGEWGEWMKAVAKNQNLYVKLSGLGTTAGKHNFTSETIKPYVQFVIEHFGTGRIFCGGDWPVSLLGKDYINTWNIYKQVLRELLSEPEIDDVLYNNASKFYNID